MQVSRWLENKQRHTHDKAGINYGASFVLNSKIFVLMCV